MSTEKGEGEMQEYMKVGSNGASHDLYFAKEGGSVARKSCAAIGAVYEAKMVALPMLQKNINMDISHAYLWNTAAHVPLATVLTFWFMADPINDERIHIWFFNPYRFASEGDCQRGPQRVIRQRPVDHQNYVCSVVQRQGFWRGNN